MTLGEMQQQMLSFKVHSMIESGIEVPSDQTAKKPARKRRADSDDDWSDEPRRSCRAPRKCYAEDDGQDD
jgi:hypothetical protein